MVNWSNCREFDTLQNDEAHVRPAAGKIGEIMRIKIAVIATVSLLMAAPALAADPTGTWYLGAGAGQSRAKIADSSISSVLLGSGRTAGATTKDETDFSYKFFAGYQMNRYFAVEGGVFNLGEYSFTTTTVPAATLNGSLKNHRGGNLDLVGRIPIGEQFSVFARLGVQTSKTTDLFGGTAVAATAPSKNRTDYKAGAGAEFDFTKNVGVRAEWERYRVGDGFNGKLDVDVVSASLLYRF
jgi:OmpA-OmpF porin, OOP family